MLTLPSSLRVFAKNRPHRYAKVLRWAGWSGGERTAPAGRIGGPVSLFQPAQRPREGAVVCRRRPRHLVTSDWRVEPSRCHDLHGLCVRMVPTSPVGVEMRMSDLTLDPGRHRPEQRAASPAMASCMTPSRRIFDTSGTNGDVKRLIGHGRRKSISCLSTGGLPATDS